MPANQRPQSAQSPASSTFQSTAKYTNKDGSKFITIPKTYNSTDSSEPSPAMAQTNIQSNGQVPNSSAASGVPTTVNRKKAKRRQKQAEQAARLAAGQTSEAQTPIGPPSPKQSNEPSQMKESQANLDKDDNQNINHLDNVEGDQPYFSDEDPEGFSASYEPGATSPNGHANLRQPPLSKAAKKRAKNKAAQNGGTNTTGQSAKQSNQVGMSKEKIWNTSSQEERERIKMFWLSLGEEERRSLVKVEKDAVLKKMKEQQKHSCSCTVCGRKRVAIEEELEVLYDAYYEELEQYANNQQGDRPPPMMAGSRRFGAMGGLQAPSRLPPAFNGRQPSRGKIVEHFGDEEDDEGDEGYSEEADEEDYLSDEDALDDISRGHATDFFNFGQSLTVQGGILTVADDLLKNDGKKFIEMMEQLAERRMAREEDAREQYHNSNGYPHPPNGNMLGHHHHNHGPLPDEEEYDDEDEEEDDYDSQDEDYDEEEMDTMTEEQRMEEGRRMFQIFAARMFEQRVLTAYKEKVAAERQEKLLQELDEEDNAALQKKAKKAKEAAKKKEKAQAKKLALAEEKAKKEAEKAAEEAALRAEEAKKAEEARLKAEEKRKKREAQKKAEEEERLKKEAEKQRRLQEQRERQAEQERKAREAKERDKREKEEARRKEREAKDAKEREAREQKERQEREKKDHELKAKAEKEAKERQKREEQGAQQPPSLPNPPQIAKRAPQTVPIPISSAIQTNHGYGSPHVPVATPALPKAPTPNKSSTTSQRDNSGSVPQTPLVGPVQSQSTSPNPSNSQSQQSSPGPAGQSSKPTQQPFLHHPQATSPIHSALKAPPAPYQSGAFSGMQPVNMSGFQQGMPIMGPGFSSRVHHDSVFPHQQPPVGNQFRPLNGPSGMHPQSGANPMPIQQNRGFPSQQPPPGFAQQLPHGQQVGANQPFDAHKEPMPPHSHSRQQSASFDKPIFDTSPGASQTQPIARPAPIGRPSSVVQGQHFGDHGQQLRNDIDDLSNHLGSSALLDDSDEPLGNVPGSRNSGSIGRPPFVPSYSMDPPTYTNPLASYSTWGGPPNPFGGSSLPGANYGGWGNPVASSFGGMGMGPASGRPSQPRSVAVRLMLCRACKNLEGSSPDGFHMINVIRDQIERLNPPREEPVSDKELLDLCETEGNPNNGGGYFDVRNEGDGRIFIRFEPDIPSHQRAVGAPGDIGSPLVGSSIQPVSRFPGPPGGF